LLPLYKCGVMTQNMLASIMAECSAHFVERAGRREEQAKFGDLIKAGLRSPFKDLFAVILASNPSYPELEPFQSELRALAAVTEPEEQALGITLWSLLQTLQELPFAARMRFLEQMAEHCMPFLDKIASNFSPPDWVSRLFEHPGTVCAGCGVNPITGPRFECKTCPDYDLCGNCYPRSDALHAAQGGGEHPFSCQFKGKGKGKGGKGCNGCGGFGKGRDAKGSGKGRMAGLWSMVMGGKVGKGMGHKRSSCDAMAAGDDAAVRGPCSGGCGFARTSHPTHCCGVCAKKGSGKHGPKCAQILAASWAPAASPAPEH